jgi:molybdopterin-guanine dinucleotide biosynthesis protein A
MGVDKARVPFPERWPMAIAVASVLEQVCERVALVRTVDDGLPWLFPDGRTPEIVMEAPSLAAPAGKAPSPDRHPLKGVAAALAACRTGSALIVPCDVPWLTAASLRRLVDAGEAVAAGDGHVQPLIGCYRVGRRELAEGLAAAGAPAKRFADGIATVDLDPAELADLDSWQGRPGPIRSLLDRLPWLDDAARQRVREGEIARLAARGVLDPDRN